MRAATAATFATGPTPLPTFSIDDRAALTIERPRSSFASFAFTVSIAAIMHSFSAPGMIAPDSDAAGGLLHRCR